MFYDEISLFRINFFISSFLDKMYVLSSGEAMAKFMKNPRSYLLPPQPRPPAKLCVMGPPHSGKTTLCHNLAEKYGAEVIIVDHKTFVIFTSFGHSVTA